MKRAVDLMLAASLTAVMTSVFSAELIPRITHDEVLRHVASERSVVFVDARELDEWAEERLPGAIHLPLRATISPERMRSVPRDAMLVPYCIKDFRGYEVARALRRAGYVVRVLDDPGLRGWKNARLPIAGALAQASDEQAARALLARAASRASR